RARLTAVGTFLRYAGVLAPLVFLAQFLLLSPAGDLARGGDDSEARAPTAEAPAGGDLPSVVFVVLDALPTAMLLDGDGAIDAELYPNLAALAGEATWYRNYTTWSAYTYEAVPSLLTGRVPGTETVIPDAARYPDNLFTLLAATHDIDAVEQITRLCPPALCRSDRDRAFVDLLRTARDWWVDGTAGDLDHGARVLPGQLEPDRGDELIRWIDGIDPGASDRPGLWFHHVLLPHEPWVLLPD